MLAHVIINRLNELCMHMHIFPLQQKLKQTLTDDGYGMQQCPYQLAGHSVPPIVFFPNHKQILLVGRSVDLLAVLRGTSGCLVVDSWKCQRHWMANKLLAASVPKTLCTSAIFLYDLCFSLLLNFFLSWQNAKYENKIIVKLFCRRLQFLFFFGFL